MHQNLTAFTCKVCKNTLTGFNSVCMLGLEECLQSRPPMRLDLTGPKPTTYDPPTSLPWVTSSPSYTMRPKTQPEKGNYYIS